MPAANIVPIIIMPLNAFVIEEIEAREQIHTSVLATQTEPSLTMAGLSWRSESSQCGCQDLAPTFAVHLGKKKHYYTPDAYREYCAVSVALLRGYLYCLGRALLSQLRLRPARWEGPCSYEFISCLTLFSSAVPANLSPESRTHTRLRQGP